MEGNSWSNLSFTFSAPTSPVLPGSQVPDYKPVLFVIGKDVNDDNITRLAPVKIIELTPIKFYLNDKIAKINNQNILLKINVLSLFSEYKNAKLFHNNSNINICSNDYDVYGWM